MKNVLDVENIIKTKQKIEMYNKEESIKLDSINNQLKNINSIIDLSSSSKFDEFQIEFENKFKIIKKIHENDSTVLFKNAEKYEEVARITNRTFENIYKG